jgi:hypothetical protein
MPRHDLATINRLRFVAALLGCMSVPTVAMCADVALQNPDSPPSAGADAAGLDLAPARIDIQPQATPAEPAKSEQAAAQPAKLETGPARVQFGDAGTTWTTLGGGMAYNGKDSDENIFLTYEYFIAKNVELFGELGVWQFSQPGPDATGFNLSIVTRWHFINKGKWTLFGDIGIGLLGATDPVPRRDGEVGTQFNFTPRAGGGFTRQLSDDGVRLEVGLRWAHVSNARISGNNDNPGRDSLMLYAGLIFPF